MSPITLCAIALAFPAGSQAADATNSDLSVAARMFAAAGAAVSMCVCVSLFLFSGGA